MPGAGRLGDLASVSGDAHGCPACPHSCVGPAILGSPNVNINNLPALRIQDVGIHAACCGPNMWVAMRGAPTVFINGRAAYRLNDPSKHCGTVGRLVQGSADVIIGDAGSAGGGGSGGSAASSAGSGGSQASSGSQASAGSHTSSATVGPGGAGGVADGPHGRDEIARRGATPKDRAATPAKPVEKHWIEIQLLDHDGRHVAEEPYVLVLPDGRSRRGRLSAQGTLRLDDLRAAGNCKIRFPWRDEEVGEDLAGESARRDLH